LGLATPADVVGHDDAAFFEADLARAAREEERELFRSGQSVLGRVSHDVRRDRWYLATKVPLRDAAGRITGLVGISKDVTDRRRTEQQLEQDLRSFLDVANSVARVT